MLDWLHELPTALGALIVCVAFVLPTLAGSYLLQPSVARLFRGERDINTVLGFLLNAFALYFGVLLALLSIAVFENYNKAEDTVEREAAGLVKLYGDLRGYPEPIRTQLTDTLHKYVDEVIGPGWLMQARGEASPAEIAIMNDFYTLIGQFQPGNAGEGLRHAQALRAVDELTQSRRLRVAAGGTAIPKIMWFVVLFGAAMNIVVIWMFDLRPSTHAIIGGTLSLFVGLLIFMVAALDAPFKGRNGLKPGPIIAIHDQSGMRH